MLRGLQLRSFVFRFPFSLSLRNNCNYYFTKDDCDLLYETKENDLARLGIVFQDLITTGKIPTSTGCSIVLRGLIENKQTEDAQEFLETVMQHGIASSSMFSSLFRALIEDNQASRAISLLQTIEKETIYQSLVNYNDFMKHLINNNEIKAAESLLRVSIAPVLPTSVYERLIRYYGKQNHMEKLYNTIQTYRNSKNSIHAKQYGKWISFFVSSRKHSQNAKWLLEQMISEGQIPNVMTISQVANSLIRSGHNEDAFACLKILKDHSIPPNDILFSSMIDKSLKQGNLSAVDQILVEMENFNIKPNVVTYTSIIDSLAKYGKYAEAQQYFQEMKRRGISPNHVTFNVLLNIYATLGELKHTKTILEEMKSYSIVPDKTTYSILLKSLINVSSPNLSNHVNEIVNDMKVSSVSMDINICNQVIKVLLTHKKIDDLHLFLHEMNDLGISYDTITFNTLLRWKIDQNQQAGAQELISQMKNANITWDLVTFVEILRLYSIIGDKSNVHEVYRDLEANNNFLFDSVLLTCFVTSFVECGAVDDAYEILQKVQKTHNVKATVQMYSKLISGLMKHSRQLDALHMFSEMKLLDIKPDIIAYNTLLQGIVSFGHPNDLNLILRYWNELHSQGLKPNIQTYNIIIRAHLNADKGSEALKYWDLLHYQGLRPAESTYNEFLSSFCTKNEPENALRIEEQMKQENIPFSLQSIQLLKRFPSKEDINSQ